MASYRRDVGPMNKTFDTTTGGEATVENLGMVDKETRQKRLLETQPGGAAESVDTVFPDVEAAVAASAEAKAESDDDAPEENLNEKIGDPEIVAAQGEPEVEGNAVPAPGVPAVEEEVHDDAEAVEVPEGTLDTVKEAKGYVNDAEGEERKARAEAVLAKEKASDDPRVTLVDWLEDVLAEG